MNQTENTKKEYSYAEFMISRSPKKNHDVILQLENKSLDVFGGEGVPYDLFMLGNSTSWEGFSNISKAMSASQGEEDVWVNIMSYRDKKHRDEFVAKMSNDKECQEGYEEFTKLLTPGSEIVTGEF